MMMALDWTQISFGFIGGLALFLFGLNYMGDGLKLFAGDKMKDIIEKYTSNPISGVILGVIATGLLQSSSGTTAIVIALVSARLMTLKQSIGVIMGANVGTTVTAFLIGVKISNYALPIIGLGIILMFFFQRKKIIYFGRILFGFGLLFHGLSIMSDALKVLRSYQPFIEMLESFSDNPVLAATVGAFFTAIVQSSSASIGIVQEMYGNDLIILPSAIALTLGANIGTTITAFLASMGGSKVSKQAALGHILFNVIGSLLFLLLIYPYSHIINLLFSGATSEMQIAIAHGIFNLIAVIMFFPFIGALTKLIEKLIPNNDDMDSYDIILNDNLIDQPSFALLQAKNALIYSAKLTVKQNEIVYLYAKEPNKKLLSKVAGIEEMINSIERQLKIFLVKISDHELTTYESQMHSVIFQSIKEFERIGDNYKHIVSIYENCLEKKMSFGQEGFKEIKRMFKITLKMQDLLIIALENNDKKVAKEVCDIEADLDELYNISKEAHYTRLKGKECLPDASVHFTTVLSMLERVGDHCESVAKRIITPVKKTSKVLDLASIDKLLD